jgi:hypothetical protein
MVDVWPSLSFGGRRFSGKRQFGASIPLSPQQCGEKGLCGLWAQDEEIDSLFKERRSAQNPASQRAFMPLLQSFRTLPVIHNSAEIRRSALETLRYSG